MSAPTMSEGKFWSACCEYTLALKALTLECLRVSDNFEDRLVVSPWQRSASRGYKTLESFWQRVVSEQLFHRDSIKMPALALRRRNPGECENLI
jgi:hypothetical protein